MLVLASTTDKVEIVLGSSVTTNELQFYASWRDITTTAIQPGRSVGVTNGTTDADLITAPAASTTRSIDYISVNNTDTVNSLVIIKYSDNGTERVLTSCLLLPGDKIEYQEKKGVRVIKSSGGFLTELSEDNNILVSGTSLLVLKNDFLHISTYTFSSVRIPEFDIAVKKNTTYKVDCKIFFNNSSGGTNSIGLVFGRNFAPVTGALYGENSVSGGSRQFRHGVTAGVAGFERSLGYINNTNATVGENFLLFEGFFKSSYDGIIPTFLIKSSTGNHTIRKGSHIRYTPVI